jgi:hypothetical protein
MRSDCQNDVAAAVLKNRHRALLGKLACFSSNFTHAEVNSVIIGIPATGAVRRTILTRAFRSPEVRFSADLPVPRLRFYFLRVYLSMFLPRYKDAICSETKEGAAVARTLEMSGSGGAGKVRSATEGSGGLALLAEARGHTGN